jgi:hypothetical protein
MVVTLTQSLSSARQEDQDLALAAGREIADEAFGQGPVGPQKSQAAEAAAELPEKQAQELHFELARGVERGGTSMGRSASTMVPGRIPSPTDRPVGPRTTMVPPFMRLPR